MGTHTKKVLDFTSTNKFCRICEASKSKGKEPGCLDCHINHTGSSKSMEAAVGVRLFQQAPNHGVKYNMFIGDDDSATIAQIREEVEYNVEKWSEASLATRTIVKISQGSPHFHKRLLSTFGSALATVCQNKGEPERLIVPHAFGDHQQCQDHKLNWCKYIKNPDGTALLVPKLQKFDLVMAVKVLTKGVAAAVAQTNLGKQYLLQSRSKGLRHFQKNDIFISYLFINIISANSFPPKQCCGLGFLISGLSASRIKQLCNGGVQEMSKKIIKTQCSENY